MKTRTRLSKPSTIAMWVASIAILGVFVFPLWNIGLRAPQYPQGLGLEIWIGSIEGATLHDLQNINGLNHYIGMRPIVAEAFPELRYMKYFAAGLAALAALVALLRRRRALVAWTILALVLAGAGMYDFYKWSYDYGHNLDPSAAIKIPGMSYQPPMIGTKQLLNFTATAYPGIGGLLAMLGVGLGGLALVYEFARARKLRHESTDHAPAGKPAHVAVVVMSVMLTALAAGCARGPQAIAYGTDACEFCSMTISDDRYGAAIVTSKGRTHKFDSVECMLQSVMEGEKLAGTTVQSWYATSYPKRGILMDATAIVFLVSPNLPSPMGGGVTAFSARQDAERMQQEKGGEVFDWTGVGDFIRSWSET